MADVLYLLLIIGFFALMVLLVKACDHIIGPDETTAAPPTGDTVPGPMGDRVPS